MEYKEKLRAFLEGLECQEIDELMEISADAFRLLGSVMASKIKTLSDPCHDLCGDFKLSCRGNYGTDICSVYNHLYFMTK